MLESSPGLGSIRPIFFGVWITYSILSLYPYLSVEKIITPQVVMRFKRAAVYENIFYVLTCISPSYYNELNMLKAVG